MVQPQLHGVSQTCQKRARIGRPVPVLHLCLHQVWTVPRPNWAGSPRPSHLQGRGSQSVTVESAFDGCLSPPIKPTFL